MSIAGVMELADVLDSKSSGSDTVSVRPRSPAPKNPSCFSAWRIFHFTAKEVQMNQPELFSFLEKKLTEKSRFVLAIDGGAASGKTTLAAMLAERFDGAVIHMDDFFLRPEQRTEERLDEPGGNVDRERFLSEVMPHLHTEKPFSYRRFDCSAMALGDTVTVENKALLVVEGSYSHHPAFSGAYDLKLFLHTDEDIRKNRLLLRNGAAYSMFLNRWIPLENRYFRAFSIRENADIVIEGSP